MTRAKGPSLVALYKKKTSTKGNSNYSNYAHSISCEAIVFDIAADVLGQKRCKMGQQKKPVGS